MVNKEKNAKLVFKLSADIPTIVATSDLSVPEDIDVIYIYTGNYTILENDNKVSPAIGCFRDSASTVQVMIFKRDLAEGHDDQYVLTRIQTISPGQLANKMVLEKVRFQNEPLLQSHEMRGIQRVSSINDTIHS